MNKALPQQAVLGLMVAFGALVLTLGWFATVRPLGHKASSLHAQTADVYRQIAADVAASAPASATGAPAIRVADVYKLATAMPSIADMPDVLLELDRTARSAGVNLLSISPSQPVAGTSGYSVVKLTLSVQGSFYSVTDLLFRLRNLVYVRNGALQANGRLFSVDDATLTPSGTGSKNSLTGTIDVDTYVYGTAAATATTPTETTTDTTTTTTPSSGPTAAGATP